MLLVLGLVTAVCFGMAKSAFAQSPPGGARQFHPGSVRQAEDLPPGRFRERLANLPETARLRALEWLRDFHFTELDLNSLRIDSSGGIFYADTFTLQAGPVPSADEPVIGAAAIPISPFPASLKFHSHPGSPNVLYLNFAGETITSGQWLTEVGRSAIPAVAFSTDADYSTYSDAEQSAITNIWQRVSEDYAPFDVDVTTERPAIFTTRTAHALITRNTDANGDPNPYPSSGGVAYVNVFASSSFATYRPAWIYFNNLAGGESYISEATSHEIGHNLGLSHDGRTDGTEYYGGHGSGDTSWGPLMGNGYNRNVSQWCKGDYYLANNTEDDLAIISGKITYRPDDRGNTAGTAAPLVINGLTNVASTTPENDPTNTNSANKGVLERNTDVDVFSFTTGNGTMSLAVKPWSLPSGITRGGNLDLLVELRDSTGNLVLTNNPASQTTALIQTNLTEGVYYLHVRNVGTGAPTNSTPTGYTAYGSIGQYFISGYLVPSGFLVPPLAEAQLSDLTQTGVGAKSFTVTYSDNVAINVATLDNFDVRITGPNGYDRPGQFFSVDNPLSGSPRSATYTAAPPDNSTWTAANNGTYSVSMQTNQVNDTEGAPVAPGSLGQFSVQIPVPVYGANMDADPGWTLTAQWQYGLPAYPGAGPTAGYTGSKILAYNLSGNYGNNLATAYATTPAINCSNASGLSLRFHRWLRLKNQDTAVIQVSTNGTAWTDVWSTARAVTDSSWQVFQYNLPTWTAGAGALRLRWGIGSGPTQTDLGWNIDDVEILASGSVDTTPPLAILNVANITSSGSPSHSLTVNYADNTAVNVASLGAGDLLVTGPNNYSNLVDFVSVDILTDGTPRTGTYSIPAPGGAWDATDNGSYQVTLLDGEVLDPFNNTAPQSVLGSFTVSIPVSQPVILVSTTTLTVPEGGNAAFTVRLTEAPVSEVTVLTTRVSGDTDLAIQGGSTNVFTSANWSNPVPVTIAALNDPDQQSGSATFNCSAGGLTTVLVLATELDNTPDVTLSATVNVPAWGSVSPTNGSYPVGATVQVTASPATYFLFSQWTGDESGTVNPLPVLLRSNITLQAVFGEILTTNYPTPLWWLASYGFTQDVETAVTSIGPNGMPLWQTYIAGLNPTNPTSQLLLSLDRNDSDLVLNWNTVSGRVYTIWESTNLTASFAPLMVASNLPSSIQSLTNPPSNPSPATFYRLQVQKP